MRFGVTYYEYGHLASLGFYPDNAADGFAIGALFTTLSTMANELELVRAKGKMTIRFQRPYAVTPSTDKRNVSESVDAAASDTIPSDPPVRAG